MSKYIIKRDESQDADGNAIHTLCIGEPNEGMAPTEWQDLNHGEPCTTLDESAGGGSLYLEEATSFSPAPIRRASSL